MTMQGPDDIHGLAYNVGYMFYKRDGTPIRDLPDKPAVIQWGEELAKNRRVCKTSFFWGGWLSTVYLGMNHAWNLEDPPLIFETMLFGFVDEPQIRYSTEKEAIAGHSAMVREYRIPIKPLLRWATDRLKEKLCRK